MYNAYQKHDRRRIKPEMVIAILIALVVSAVLIFVYVDLKRNPDEIDDSENSPVVGEFESSIEKFVQFETDRYTLDLPETWVQVNNPQKRFTKDGTSRAYSPERFQGVERNDVGKSIDIYYGDDLPIVVLDRALKISPSGSMINVGMLSPRCIDFTEPIENQNGNETFTEYEDSRFICAMNSVTNVTGAFETVPEAGIFLKGEENQNQYLFVYTDNSSRPNNSTFLKILRSFKAK